MTDTILTKWLVITFRNKTSRNNLSDIMHEEQYHFWSISVKNILLEFENEKNFWHTQTGNFLKNKWPVLLKNIKVTKDKICGNFSR